MGEVSYLKLKLADMEQNHIQGTERQHKAEVRGCSNASIPGTLLKVVKNLKESSLKIPSQGFGKQCTKPFFLVFW